MLKDLESVFLVTKTSVGLSVWTSLTLMTFTFTQLHPFVTLHQTLKLPPPTPNLELRTLFFFFSSLCSLLQSNHLLLPTAIGMDVNNEDGSEISASPSFRSPDRDFQLAVLTLHSTYPESDSLHPQKKLVCCFPSSLNHSSIKQALKISEGREEN